MAATVREVVTDVAISTTATVTTGAGTQDTDLLLAIGMSEFYNLASQTFGPPSGGGWTEQETAQLAGDDTKIRAWTKTAPGGATQVDLDPMIDEGIALAVLVLEGADLADPVEDSAGAASSAATPSVHVAPSVSPASADAFLVAAAATAVFGGTAAYTPPGSMAEQYEISTSGGGDTSFTAATEQLASSGATGTRSFTFANDGVAGVALALAIAAAGGAEITGTVASTAPAGLASAAGGVLAAGGAASTAQPGAAAAAGAVHVTGAAAAAAPAGQTSAAGATVITGTVTSAAPAGAAAGTGGVAIAGAVAAVAPAGLASVIGGDSITPGVAVAGGSFPELAAGGSSPQLVAAGTSPTLTTGGVP